MRYSEARLTPESQVTQTTPLERRAARRPDSDERIRRRKDRAFTEINRNWESGNAMYKMGEHRGRLKGFIYGLVTGALAVAVLAAVVLGDVLEHF